jgi:hypothetical protein
MKKFVLIGLSVFCLSAAILADIYESLEITKEDAKKCLLESIGNGYLSRGDKSDLVSNARNLPVEIRQSGVRELIHFAKEYTATEEFKKDYKKWRNNKINPGSKSKLGIPKLGKILDNKIDNQVDKKDNEKKYPADPAELIKKRLEDFLAVSATVDFDAAAEGDYHQKSPEYKMCYRAGKEVVDAAREEAQSWLDEIK